MTEKEATIKADELCKRLGEGWQPRVWHNLYWCYCAVNNGVHISVRDYRGEISYSAFFYPNSIVVGHSNLSPNLALVDLQTKYKACYEQRKTYWEVLAQVKAEI